MSGTEEIPEEIRDSPKTTKECILQLLQTIGLKFFLEVKSENGESIDSEDIDHIDLDETDDMIALYRLVCYLGKQDEMRGFFEVSQTIEDETLDYIERQFEGLN